MRQKKQILQTHRNQGFTLIELVVVLAIMAVLIGIVVPSLNAIMGYKVTRAVNSIAGALDETKTEAMSRLVGEVEFRQDDGGAYMITYTHRGKTAGVVEKKEAFAPGNMMIYYTTSDGKSYSLREKPLLLTFDREDGSFRPVQTAAVSIDEINDALGREQNVAFHNDGEIYCTSITVNNRMRTRVLTLYPATGQYELQ